MAASIQPIEGRSVHQIQSGQVIVDLCSVVKELVENSIDADATNIDVRFKNQGLDLIEVQDNGSGISAANHAFVALKHHTSKLSSYSDIASLQTFGFRGEALASLCALSNLTVTTCLQADVPKGSRLSFASSGHFVDTAVVAAPRGTTVSVDRLFHNLPVRRRELERNIKREWHKVIALLNQFACIQKNLKFSVSQQPTKGKRILLFSTKGNPTTRENLINIFGAKSMSALVPMDLDLEMQPSAASPGLSVTTAHPGAVSNKVRIVGHISRPSPGGGRQVPDRQMFFVNGRPCGLPQLAKTFNEVYKSYNVSQSPFIFANVQLDTHMYDVNVSPDKRSILLHDQSRLLDTLRVSLVALFDAHDHSVPVSQPLKGPGYGEMAPCPLTSQTAATAQIQSDGENGPHDNPNIPEASSGGESRRQKAAEATDTSWHRPGRDHNLMNQWLNRDADQPASPISDISKEQPGSICKPMCNTSDEAALIGPEAGRSGQAYATPEADPSGPWRPVRDFNQRLAENRTVAMVASESARSGTASNSDVTTGIDVLGDVDDPAFQSLKLPSRDAESPAPSPRPLNHPEPRKTASDGNPPTTKRQRRGAELLPGKASANPAASRAVDIAPLADADEAAATHDGVSHDQDLEIDSQDCLIGSQVTTPSPDVHGAQYGPQEPGVKSPGTNSGTEACRGDASAWRDDFPGAQPLRPGTRRSKILPQATRRLHTDEEAVWSRMSDWVSRRPVECSAAPTVDEVEDISAPDAESKIRLIISRGDFARMRVVGQFNMGFIIAVRPAAHEAVESGRARDDELFIIDQHASDEKYNFERLQGTTTVQSQRLVHPKQLQLSALEEEIVMENLAAIEANGFKVAVDATGDLPVGSRCQVEALPLSRETTFSLEDLEELISLLGEGGSGSEHVPRPSRVRKMFAMRACRSSIMIGKALTGSQMNALLRKMGELDKPWNCPHGRPTMRHLCQLRAWDDKCWKGDTIVNSSSVWRGYGTGTGG